MSRLVGRAFPPPAPGRHGVDIAKRVFDVVVASALLAATARCYLMVGRGRLSKSGELR